MSSNIATLTLTPSCKPRFLHKVPGNFPSSETELLDEQDETERAKQIQTETRTLLFTPKNRVYRIGRASNNPNKALEATRYNGYFLNPVMSRFHAEIEMDETKVGHLLSFQFYTLMRQLRNSIISPPLVFLYCDIFCTSNSIYLSAPR